MLKIFGTICFVLGIGGIVVAASTRSNDNGRSMGPDWFYSRY